VPSCKQDKNITIYNFLTSFEISKPIWMKF
jgi:hypothetical protein